MDLGKVLKKYEFTHMPYIFYLDGNPMMLFTVMLNNFWKLYYTNFLRGYKIKTPLDLILGSTRYHMCQPACYKLNNIYKVSFCIQFRNEISLYYCLTLSLRNLKNLKLVKKQCYGGCISPNYIIINLINDVIYVLKKPSEEITEIENVFSYDILHEFQMTHPHLARTSYVYNHENYIIISYADPKIFNNYGSLYINLELPEKQRLIFDADNQPLYKATVDPLTETIYYGKKIGLSFELRKIIKVPSNNIIVKDCNWLKINK